MWDYRHDSKRLCCLRTKFDSSLTFPAPFLLSSFCSFSFSSELDCILLSDGTQPEVKNGQITLSALFN